MRSFLSTTLALFFCTQSCLFTQESVEDHIHHNHYENVERDYTPSYLHQATGKDRILGDDSQRAPWPFDILSIGHSMASYQQYGWSSAYFHHGLDIRGDAGTPVLASRGGKVVNVGNYGGGSRLYWEVAILDESGYLWQYHHIDHQTIPEQVKTAFKNQGSVPAGTKLGEIVDWPVSTFGERYHHIHLNVIGKGGVYLNPFHFLELLPDEADPKIHKIGLLNSKRKVLSGSSVSGDYALYVETTDLILHNRFTVPPYSISYKIDKGEWIDHWVFDKLPGGADRDAYVSDFFVPAKTCGDYQCRRILIDLGFSTEGRKNFPTDHGAHIIELKLMDYRGNFAYGAYRWEISE